MATAFDIDEQAQRATTGTQNFTGSLGSVNGECGIILSSRCVVLGTIADHAEWDIGFVVGSSTQARHSANSEHNAVPDARTNKSVSFCVSHYQPGTSVVQDHATANAQINNGLQIDFTTVSSVQYRTGFGLFGGSEISSAIAVVDEGTTSNGGTFSITGLSFKPQAIILLFDGEPSGNNENFKPGVGVAVDNGSGTDQFAVGYRILAIATSEGDAYFATNRCFVNVKTTSFSNAWEVTAWNSDGVTFTQRTGSGSNATARVLCLASSDWNFVAGTYDVPTSGNITLSSLGIDPKFLFDCVTQIQTTDTHIDNSVEASAMGMTLVSAGSEFGISTSVKRNVTTSVTKSISKAAAVCLEDGGTLDIESTTALGTDQFVKTFTNNPSSVTKAFYLAGGALTAAGVNTDIAVPTGPIR